MNPRPCPVCGSANPQPLPRERWEWLVGLFVPRRPYRCQSCPVRYWSWTPEFFSPLRSMVWLLLAFVLFALVRPEVTTRLAARRGGQATDAPPAAAAGAGVTTPGSALPDGAVTAAPQPGGEPETASPPAATAELDARLADAERELERLNQALADSEAERGALAAELTAAREARPPAATDAAAQSSPERAAVIAAVEAWADAWAEQRVEDYLAAYAPTYAPPGSSRAAWEALRRARLSAPTAIDLTLSAMMVVVVDPTRATVQFRQRYAADTYRDEVLKRLTLAREGESWKIVEETVIEA